VHEDAQLRQRLDALRRRVRQIARKSGHRQKVLTPAVVIAEPKIELPVDTLEPEFRMSRRVCLFCDDGPEAGRMKPELVLSNVKGPVIVEVSAEVKRSQFDDGFGH